MTQPSPGQIRRIEQHESFTFSCHPGISCFTTCCHDLELALTPYDLLRLRYATGLRSDEILERLVIIEQSPEDAFPHFYLTMVDDGKASCVFLGSNGCEIYQHRPGACRAYPVGRAARRKLEGLDEFFVLLREPHCQGFRELKNHSVSTFMRSQDLDKFNHFNDLLTEITQHEAIRLGLKPDNEQIRTYILALHDLDTFRDQLRTGDRQAHPAAPPPGVYEDDEELLAYGMHWVKQALF